MFLEAYQNNPPNPHPLKKAQMISNKFIRILSWFYLILILGLCTLNPSGKICLLVLVQFSGLRIFDQFLFLKKLRLLIH